MRARWEWPEQFSALVPRSWRVDHAEGAIELTPPGNAGAAHLTFLRRVRENPPSLEEACELVDGLIRRIEVSARSVAERSYAPEGVVCVEHVIGPVYQWEVGAKVWMTGAVAFTYAHAGASRRRRQALRVFSSIAPAEPGRG